MTASIITKILSIFMFGGTGYRNRLPSPTGMITMKTQKKIFPVTGSESGYLLQVLRFFLLFSLNSLIRISGR